MIKPDMMLIETANDKKTIRWVANEYPVIAIEACKAGLKRSRWSEIKGPKNGDSIEHWYQSDNGELAYSNEKQGTVRLIIFSRQGQAIAEIHHAIRKAA